MSAPGWSTPHWPDGVPREVSGYERPLFSILDETDGRLVTGQQQYSGAAAARLVIEALGR